MCVCVYDLPREIASEFKGERLEKKQYKQAATHTRISTPGYILYVFYRITRRCCCYDEIFRQFAPSHQPLPQQRTTRTRGITTVVQSVLTGAVKIFMLRAFSLGGSARTSGFVLRPGEVRVRPDDIRTPNAVGFRRRVFGPCAGASCRTYRVDGRATARTDTPRAHKIRDEKSRVPPPSLPVPPLQRGGWGGG